MDGGVNNASNRPAVVVFNGVPYSYVKNLQGDIVAMLDSTGAVVVAYTYDAWGKPIATTGSMADTLGAVQPFRYRGYVVDEKGGVAYEEAAVADGMLPGAADGHGPGGGAGGACLR